MPENLESDRNHEINFLSGVAFFFKFDEEILVMLKYFCRAVFMALLFFVSPNFASDDPSGKKMTARIDELLERAWKNEGDAVAPIASDAVFLRRVSLCFSTAAR